MQTKMIAAIVALAMGGVVLAGCNDKTTVNNAGSNTTGVSVSGNGQAFGAPDVAVVTIGVQADAPTVAAARESAASTAQAIIDSLKKNGVADKDAQTTQFNIDPQYDFRPGASQNVITGYRVTNVLTVKVRKIDTTSRVLDDAPAAGGNNTVVRGVTFTIDDPTKLRETARTSALKEAQAKAEQLAKDSGVKLGKPISISENSGPVPFAANVVTAPRTGPGDTSTPIQTGELTVSITVNVLYAID
jgi:uncharacterized protein YggE